MQKKNSATAEFETAIINFSKISLEVDELTELGNSDAHKILNKSIEDRQTAIAHEASRRLKSFETEQKVTKSKESLQTHGTLEKLLLEEVELEFDKGVEEQKVMLRGNSAIYENKVESKKSENQNKDEKKDGSSEDETDSESSDEGSTDSSDTDTETTDADSSDEEEEDDDEDDDDDDDEDSSENENTEDENIEEEEVTAPDKADD